MQDTVSYTYGDSAWGDLLTAWDGQTITYDGIGNPTSDGTWNYTWEHGRELASMTSDGTTWTYTYNADGLRTSRTNSSTTYEYIYTGSQLTQMTMNDSGTLRTMYFIYDASGPIAIKMTNGTSSTTYYYVKNIQGDIIAIVNKAGTAVVTYTYDAWGNILSIGGEYKNGLGVRNPLRYRGYVYDTETQFYYLHSRYYDPEIGRFTNADSYVSTGQGVLGNIMFAYCRNNPISRIDVSGTADADCFNEDGEILSNDDIENRNGGGGGQSSGRLFSSFKALKNYLGSPGENNHWHHIVEQCQTNKSGFTYEQINNTSNVIAVDANTHANITGYYNTTTFPFTNGLSVRNWLSGQPYAVQFDFGMSVLQQFGVIK